MIIYKASFQTKLHQELKQLQFLSLLPLLLHLLPTRLFFSNKSTFVDDKDNCSHDNLDLYKHTM